MHKDPLAIVGIGCRFPGASSPRALWDLLIGERDVVRRIPRDRLLLRRCADPSLEERDRIPDRGGFLEGFEGFDAELFHFSPREAERTDPQHRLALHVTWEALEDGAVSPERLRGAPVPVFFGMLESDYHVLSIVDPEGFDLYATVNTSHGGLAGRIAHFFDWSGPAVGLDTACSSSLTALHLACQSLWSGDAEVGVAGGSNLLLTPELSRAFARVQMLAADGRCKAFDARADGFVRSEGVAAVVIKTLAAARRDGNPIRALIRETRLNHDGGSGQYKTPSRAGQRALLEELYARAGLSPLETQYVEAHGTGTRAGDPIEAGALGDVLCAGRRHDDPLWVGSAKTNLGHCEAAAGMAGLTKVALALEHRVIPANLHFKEPNPSIAWDRLPLRVPTAARAWPDTAGRPARAGISAFGLTGVNAHILLEEAAPAPARPCPVARPGLFLLSASDRSSLAESARRLAAHLQRAPAAVEDVARTLAQGRSPRPVRAAVVGATEEDLHEALVALADGSPHVIAAQGAASAPRVCFVFPGQGGQWPGMGRRLLAEQPAFRASLEETAAAVQREAGFDVLEELARPEEESRFGDIAVVQPSLFAVEVALAALWSALGVRPAAVVGHSMGEVAAAVVAGILSVDDAARVICRRSRLMRGLPGEGAMLVVDLPEEQVAALVARAPDRIALAVHNGPRSRVLSGDVAVLRPLAAELEAAGAFARFVNVNVASHSPQMEPLRASLSAALAEVRGRPSTVPLYSTVRRRFGRRSDDGPAFDAAYWWENLRVTVRFAEAVEDVIASGIEIFLEMSPHPVLGQAIAQSAAATPGLAALGCMAKRQDERLSLLQAAAELYTRGVPVAADRLFEPGPLLRLPTTAFHEERFPVDYARSQSRGRPAPGEAVHALPVVVSRPMERSTEVRWSVTLAPQEQPLWDGHRVGKEIVFPGAGYLELALSLGRRVLGEGPLEAMAFSFERALYLPERSAVELQVVAQRESEHACSLTFYSVGGRRHATGSLRHAGPLFSVPPPSSAVQPSQRWDGEDFYASLEALGLHYTGAFRRLTEVVVGDGRGLGRLAEPTAAELEGFTVHPAILDACFQAGFAAVPEARGGRSALYLPVSLRSLTLFAPSLSGAATVLVRRVPQERGAGAGFAVDLDIRSDSGELLARVRGFEATRLAGALRPASLRPQVLYRLDDRRAPLAATSEGPRARRWLVLSAERGVGAAVAELLERRGCVVVRVQRSMRASDGFASLGPNRMRVRAGSLPDHLAVLDRLVAEGSPPDGVLDFAALAEQPLDTAPAAEVAGAVARACLPVVALVQALAERDLRPRLWLFTRERGERPVVAAVSGAQNGLGRVIALEHPELRTTLVDLGGPEAALAQAVMTELAADGPEREVRLDGDERRIVRLVQAEPAAPRAVVRPDATYLITGGLGGLGLVAARALVESGARSLLLVGRRAPSPAAEAAIDELRRLGAVVDVRPVDIADASAVEALFAHARAHPAPLRGVVHGAGVLADAMILRQDEARFVEVLPSKVQGALHLERAARGLELDFFLLFSSAAGLLGSPGQGNYAAANAFLDSFAVALRARGMPATAVQWGPWAEVGLAAHPDRGGRLSELGLLSFSPAEGAQVFLELLGRSEPVLGAMRFSAGVWQSAHPGAGSDPRFAGLTRERGTPQPAARRTQADPLAVLRAATARLVRIAEARLDPRKSIVAQGLDSLMMVDLRRTIQSSFGVDLPMAALVKGPSLEELAALIAEKQAPEARPPAAVEPSVAADLVLPAEIQPRAPAAVRASRRVLLTGATGFLGRALAQELLRAGVEELTCLVRAADDAAARARLAQVLGVVADPRVRAVAGDLSAPALGLGPVALSALLGRVSAVVHNGAEVHFQKPYAALRAANVGSFLELLRHGSAAPPIVHLVSSWAVFSTPARAGKPALETDWPEERPTGGYRETKYVAELLARQAIARGFPVQVHRPALIGFDRRSGEANPRELFRALMAVALDHGIAPDLDLRVPIVPVDVVAPAMARLVCAGEVLPHALHWSLPEPVGFRALLSWLGEEGIAVRRLPYRDWLATARRASWGTASALFLAVLPEEIGRDGYGYLEAALGEQQPAPFAVERTAERAPELLGEGLGPEVWRRFVGRLGGKAAAQAAA